LFKEEYKKPAKRFRNARVVVRPKGNPAGPLGPDLPDCEKEQYSTDTTNMYIYIHTYIVIYI
jgi:hypothetical protein